MTSRLGQQLRQWRKARGLTLEQAARAAGIGRVTLNRWEMGSQQPRLAELETLLTALGVEEKRRRQAVFLVEAPRAQAQRREILLQVGEQKGIGPMPNGGDLLRAIRLRCRLSTEEAANRAGISARTLQRWERADVWPAMEQLHALLYALGAQEEEILMLTRGVSFQTPLLSEQAFSAESLHAHSLAYINASYANRAAPQHDLQFHLLAAAAWPLAARSQEGREELAYIYAHHASYLADSARFEEARHYGERALELLTDKTVPDDYYIRAAIACARAEVLAPSRPAPERGLERLRLWMPVARIHHFKGWLLEDMALYMSMAGNTEQALSLSDAACQAVEGHPPREEIRLRRLGKAKILLRAGRPEEALSLVKLQEHDPPTRRAEIHLVWAEALLAMEDRSQSQDWLERACADINEHHLEYLRPKAEHLVRQL